MKILCFIIYTLSLLINGCTHIRKYSTFDEINTRTKNKEAKIIMKDEQELMGKDIKISSDSTFWIDPNTENKQSIITSEVINIITKNRGRGALDGLGIGFLSAGAIAALIGFLSGDTYVSGPTGFSATAEQKALIVGIFFGGVGGLLGLPIGLAVGSKDKFIINVKEEVNKETKIKEIKAKEKKEEFIFNVELSASLIPNSAILLESPPHAIKNILERELSSKGFVVVSEGDTDYKLSFSYSVDENKRQIGFTSYVINLSTDKIVGAANLQYEPYIEISITEIIKEFVNQLCLDME